MKNFLTELFEYVLVFVVVVAVVLAFNTYAIVNARIPSESMENTIMTGDRIIGNRLAYNTKNPQRFDIIIFKYPDDESVYFIKRVIGLPGETVTIIDGKVYINDSAEPLDDHFVKEAPLGTFGPYYVPGDGYFVMGDNRNCSADSRFWENTFVTRDEILGKAVFCYWPFSRFGKVDNN
ncbi:MAG TPA: signal peptidase I [Lachnospiraceae bacterium]|nr:signal peptidase I [Lachnospiraceae bacterium]